MPPVGVDIRTPDFVKVAEGLGCHARRVCDLEALRAALRVAAAADGPSLIEVDERDFT